MTEKLLIWVAWHLPRRLAYWTAIRVNSSATTTAFRDRTPDEVSVMDALRVW